MATKLEITVEKIKAAEVLLQCPLCGSKGAVVGNSWICENKHCYDISKKGYINFIPNYKQDNKYDKALFEARKTVFAAGFYEDIAAEIESIIFEYADNTKYYDAGEGKNNFCGFSLLDLGCGEGYYAKELANSKVLGENPSVLAMDIVRDALVLAAQESSPANWLVGDLMKIPVADKSIKCLLNILTPANYDEFNRILAEDGIVIKVVPSSDYLQEIRKAIFKDKAKEKYSNADVVEHFAENMELLEHRKIYYKLPVDEECWESFLAMTPMTFNLDVAQMDLPSPKEITINMDFLIARSK